MIVIVTIGVRGLFNSKALSLADGSTALLTLRSGVQNCMFPHLLQRITAYYSLLRRLLLIATACGNLLVLGNTSGY